MAKSTSSTSSAGNKRAMRKLAGDALVVGATYAGKRLMKDDRSTARPKKRHRIRKLFGLAMLAGAVYAGEKFVASRKKKRDSNKQK